MNLGSARILIVGAGIAGLALARALHVQGGRPDIIERSERWDDAGAGMYLPGNALRALRALALDAAVVKQAATIEIQRFCDHRGRLLNEIALAGVWHDAAPCIAVHRADLHAALRESPDLPPIRMGCTLVSLMQSPHRVSVQLSDGTQAIYDLVVGADGIRSSVRALVFGTSCLRPLCQWGWRLVLAHSPRVTGWSVHMGRASACLSVPIGGGRDYCYVDRMSAAPTASASGAESLFADVLAGFSDLPIDARDLARAHATCHSAAIEEVMLDSHAEGRVLLIGDAAHATGPNLAQGAAMALEDALVLTRCLCEGPTIDAALSAYEARRRPRLEWVRRMTHRRDRIRRLHPALRNGVLRAFGGSVYRAHYRPLLAEP